MKPEDIQRLYRYIRETSCKPEKFEARLADLEDGWSDPVQCLLYLPMLSMGVGPGTILPRIKYLRDNNWDVRAFGKADEEALRTLSREKISEKVQFGFEKRLPETALRAKQMADFGLANLAELLKPTTDWTAVYLYSVVSQLQTFRGVGLAASLHILMELGWGVVKPDRHVCRFLSRLGGNWARYFPKAGSDQLRPEGLLLFLKDWRDACSLLANHVDENGEADSTVVSKLTPRQVDRLIMWYTQSITRDDKDWRPQPICTKTPNCSLCTISICEYGKSI